MGSRGERQYRTTKDLFVPSRVGELRKGDLVSMVDNCYYLSAGDIARYAGHDMAMFCLQPDALAGQTANSTWGFETPDTVVELVKGGAVYRHRVWDWRRDAIVISRGFKTFLYDVTPFRITQDRYVVVLTLANTVWLPLWLLAWLIKDIRSHVLRPMQIVQQGKYHIASFGTGTAQRIHVRDFSRPGNTPVVVRPDTFSALTIAASIPNTDKKVAKTELLPAEAFRILKQMGEQHSGHEGHILSDYFTRHYQAKQLVNYQAEGAEVWEDGKPIAALAAVPLVGHGAAPCASSNNEARAVAERVVNIRNTLCFAADMPGYGDEFAGLIVPDAHKGVPWDMAELRAKQNKPAQRDRRIGEEKFVPNQGGLRTSSFQKNEVYAKVGDPRLINQVPTDHTNGLCRYSGAIKDYLKAGPARRFYMVGKTPVQVGLGLRGLFRAKGKLVGGDYSRMDGRTSVDCRRHVLNKVYRRYFAPEYHGELMPLLEKEERAMTRTKGFGHRAEMSGANISGSGVTTDLNTLDAAFMEYTARRRRGESPETAFGNLGAYFGDDSLVQEEVFSEVSSVATSVGMKMTREDEPEDAVPGRAVFLSRVYVDLESTMASHPVVERALKKLCMVSCSPAATEAQRLGLLAMKVEGILAADPQVPVIADYARALARVYKLESEEIVRARKAHERSKTAEALQYKLLNGPFPVKPDDIPLLEASVARELGCGVAELKLLQSRLARAESEEDLVACARPLGAQAPALPDWARWVPVWGTTAPSL